jgi:uncharacterized membrane protein YbhN (UPF0104 family)
MMNKIFKILTTVTLLSLCILYIYINREGLFVLKSISISNFICMVLATFSFFCASGYTFKILVNSIGAKMSLTETVGLSILTNFSNYLMPGRPGAILKAVYLKVTKKLSFSKFTAVLAANMFLALFMMGLFGTLLIPITSGVNNESGFWLLLVCITLIFVSLCPFLVKLPQVKLLGKKTEILHSALDGFNIIRNNKKELFLVCLSFVIQFLLAAITIKITYTSLDLEITLVSAMLIGVFTAIANLFTITPNNLGVQEFVIAFLATVVGLDFTDGIIGAGVMRAVHIIITFTLTPYFVYTLLHGESVRAYLEKNK